MPVPAAYTENDLALYMHDILGKTAQLIGLSVEAGDYIEAVNETLLAYGVGSITEITGRQNIMKLRALARVQAWRRVVSSTTGLYDHSADGARFSRAQVQAHAKEALQQSITEAMQYDQTYKVGTTTLTYKHDPYIYLPDERRTP